MKIEFTIPLHLLQSRIEMRGGLGKWGGGYGYQLCNGDIHQQRVG